MLILREKSSLYALPGSKSFSFSMVPYSINLAQIEMNNTDTLHWNSLTKWFSIDTPVKMRVLVMKMKVQTNPLKLKTHWTYLNGSQIITKLSFFGQFFGASVIIKFSSTRSFQPVHLSFWIVYTWKSKHDNPSMKEITYFSKLSFHFFSNETDHLIHRSH